MGAGGVRCYVFCRASVQAALDLSFVVRSSSTAVALYLNNVLSSSLYTAFASVVIVGSKS